MAGSIRRVAALAAVVSLMPLAAAAQVRPTATDVPGARAKPEARASVINWYGELQSISTHLQRVHDRALQDAELLRARTQFMAAVQRAMDAGDPELPRLAARVQRIPAEITDARRRGDAERLPALERELAQIQARFIRARSDALRQPDIARQARAYEERLRRRMIQIEPLTENLLSRTGELQRLIQSSLPQRQDD